MSVEGNKKTIMIAFAVSLVCSVLVSVSVVSLKPFQERNKKLERIKNILAAGELLYQEGAIAKIYEERIHPALVNLETGEYIPEGSYGKELDPDSFDVKKIAEDFQYSKALLSKRDLAQIKRIPRYMVIYRVVEEGKTKKIILPIYGRGLWSTMYGFMALDSDTRTIQGFTFYEHGETPGLGGEVDNPKWKATWKGKRAFDDKWNLKIEVIKGKVDRTSSEAIYQVDGLSGSTITTRGVNNLVRFWLGEDGYGPFLKKLREGAFNEQLP
jgi:Na+-transporting NADH:ubiquinone oxidoreductase subunit C